MALDKPYKDVPGTIIFDAEQSRLGYWLNQFCMSLMKAENRARFLADERAYLDEWPMTEEQKQAVLARDLNWCMRWAAISTSWPHRRHRRQELPADGRLHDRHERRGIPQHDGGRWPLGGRQSRIGEDGDAQAHRQPQGAGSKKEGN
jgi:protocatechuate 4,5-dioxygenase alpha chain